MTLVAAASLGAACQASPPPPAPPDPPRSPYEVLADRCDLGDGPACVEVAAIHRELGDLESAAGFARRACDLASPSGCAALGRAWQRGEGVQPDPAAATSAYAAACLGGHAPSCIAASEGLTGEDAAEFRRRGCSAQPILCLRPEPREPGVDPLDQANVATGMRIRREALRGCYQRSQAEHEGALRGRVALEIALGGDGRVLAVAIRENLRAAPELGACVADVVAVTQFGPTVSGTIAVVPWRVLFAPDL